MYIYIYIYVYIYPGTPLDIKKTTVFFFFILYQHIANYSSAIKFTHPIPGNVCAQDEGMVKPMYTLVLIQHHAKRIL